MQLGNYLMSKVEIQNTEGIWTVPLICICSKLNRTSLVYRVIEGSKARVDILLSCIPEAPGLIVLLSDIEFARSLFTEQTVEQF